MLVLITFNNGIKMARGEYIYILNSDDKLAPNALKKMAEAVGKYNHPDVIYTKVAICNCDINQNIYRMNLIRQ